MRKKNSDCWKSGIQKVKSPPERFLGREEKTGGRIQKVFLRHPKLFLIEHHITPWFLLPAQSFRPPLPTFSLCITVQLGHKLSNVRNTYETHLDLQKQVSHTYLTALIHHQKKPFPSIFYSFLLLLK